MAQALITRRGIVDASSDYMLYQVASEAELPVTAQDGAIAVITSFDMSPVALPRIAVDNGLTGKPPDYAPLFGSYNTDIPKVITRSGLAGGYLYGIDRVLMGGLIRVRRPTYTYSAVLGWKRVLDDLIWDGKMRQPMKTVVGTYGIVSLVDGMPRLTYTNTTARNACIVTPTGMALSEFKRYRKARFKITIEAVNASLGVYCGVDAASNFESFAQASLTRAVRHTTTGVKEVEIDISDLTGNYKVGVMAQASTVTVNRISLEV
jgi:hypothetical protein